MEIIHTLMPLFTSPGPMRLLLEERGLDALRIGGDAPQKSAADKIAMLMAAAPAVEFLLAETTPLDRAFFAAAARLRLAAMFGTGLDHIDLDAATEHGVLVTNTPGANSRCVAELALSMMLNLAHRVTWMHADLVRGVWRGRAGMELEGKTLGIVGFGHVGKRLAAFGKALGMRVLTASRTSRPQEARDLGIIEATLGTVLAEADFLSLHIPGGPDSWHFGAPELARMKPTAFLINTARGDILDLDALAAAVRERRLAGAGLDVFPTEPMSLDHPIFSLPQVIATPHAGALSREAMQRVAGCCLDEVVRIRQGRRSPSACNPAVYDRPAWRGFRDEGS